MQPLSSSPALAYTWVLPCSSPSAPGSLYVIYGPAREEEGPEWTCPLGPSLWRQLLGPNTLLGIHVTTLYGLCAPRFPQP